MTRRGARRLLLGAGVAVCLAGCGKSHPTASVKSAERAVTAPRERTPEPASVSSPPVALPIPARKPEATLFSAEPGIPFDVWLKQMAPAVAGTATASTSVPSGTEPDLRDVWLEDLKESASRAPAAAPISTAPAPVPSISPSPAMSFAPEMQPVAADVGNAPTSVDNGEANRRAANERAARRRFEVLATVYGAGPGYTGVGAGDGYTGAGAGDGYTGAGAGDGYTGITASSAAYPTMSVSSPPVVVQMATPYGFVPVIVQP
jgi:hypothetical protein